MNKIAITQATGGYDIVIGDATSSFTKMYYYDSINEVLLFNMLRTSDNTIFREAPENWTIETVTGFTTSTQIVAALEAIGIKRKIYLEDIREAQTTAPLSGTITRPADTTEYAVGDCVAPTVPSALELLGAALEVGKGGVISDVVISAGVAFAAAVIRLWIYSEEIATPIADNAAYPNLAVDRAKLIGYIDITMNAATTGSDIVIGQASIIMAYNCAPDSTSLFVDAQVTSAVTPASGDIITVSFKNILL